MPQPSTLRLAGCVTTLFDPRAIAVTEQVTGAGVVVRMEKPRDFLFWTELTLTEAQLERWLDGVRAARTQDRIEREREKARQVAAASMPAWTMGRELA